MAPVTIEKQARRLAEEGRQADPTITGVYWFPDDHEVRLVELSPQVPMAHDGKLHPFYFRASDEVPAPSGIAMIRPEEFRQLQLPTDWGGWERAVSLGNGQ